MCGGGGGGNVSNVRGGVSSVLYCIVLYHTVNYCLMLYCIEVSHTCDRAAHCSSPESSALP